ncbi:uncharacterized protein G2W53_011856 [Senna tora]|uniref:Uncharacterized protein n=1 Tax=Senna tora TaxID=362788 RepID=A0A834TW67_9FABA|nr:uncharacterized protein G2W53_011856 [Senna tora]
MRYLSPQAINSARYSTLSDPKPESFKGRDSSSSFACRRNLKVGVAYGVMVVWRGRG